MSSQGMKYDGHISRPLVRTFSYDMQGVQDLVGLLDKSGARTREAELILQYPTVYIINDERRGKYRVYVGETSDIQSRTNQHLKNDPKSRDDWQHLGESQNAQMHVIAHELFNKSLTLDIENQLMMYLGCVDAVEQVYNRRTNRQNKYYTREYFDEVFSEIWKELRDTDENLFPVEEVIRTSALFKASPFHRLTNEQISAKLEIKAHIENALENQATGQLIMVEGHAGSGKTVLLSSLFYDLMQLSRDGGVVDDEAGPMGPDLGLQRKLNVRLLVNQTQQLVVYQQIAKKLGLHSARSVTVLKPTTFINSTPVIDNGHEAVDVVLIDEAHLLLTQGEQGYSGKNHLADLLQRARVVVAVFDENQILQANQFWESSTWENVVGKHCIETVSLENQMRMLAGDETVSWVRTLIDEGIVQPLELGADGMDSAGYEVRVFDDPSEMHNEIVRRDLEGRGESSSPVEEELAQATGLSRTVATYDWPYNSNKAGAPGGYYKVEIGDFSLPWNFQIDLSKEQKRSQKDLAWAEQPHTINEVGSTFSIHGFDLNYVGVIIGPSVTYKDGKIDFDPSHSKNKKVTNRRTMSDGNKVSHAEQFLRNELNILLTRGVKGLYIYAVDEGLREVLKASVGGTAVSE